VWFLVSRRRPPRPWRAIEIPVVKYSTVEEDAMTTLAARARGYFLLPLILISQSAVRAKINDPSCTGLLIGKGTIWGGAIVLPVVAPSRFVLTQLKLKPHAVNVTV
jgi:hypothetical protein